MYKSLLLSILLIAYTLSASLLVVDTVVRGKTIVFEKTWGLPDTFDTGVDVILYNDYLIVDVVSGNTTALLGLTRSGDILWSRVFSGLDNTYITSLYPLDKGVLLTGYGSMGGEDGLLLAVVDASGSIVDKSFIKLPIGYSIEDTVFSTIYGGKVFYVLSTSYKGVRYGLVVCSDLRSRVLWATAIEVDEKTVFSGLAVVNNTLYVVSYNSATGSIDLYTLLINTGEVTSVNKLFILGGQVVINKVYSVDGILYIVGYIVVDNDYYGVAIMLNNSGYTVLRAKDKSMFLGIDSSSSNGKLLITGTIISKTIDSIAIVATKNLEIISSYIVVGSSHDVLYKAILANNSLYIIGCTNSVERSIREYSIGFETLDYTVETVNPPAIEYVELNPVHNPPLTLVDVEGRVDSIVEGGDTDAYIALLELVGTPAYKSIVVRDYDGSVPVIGRGNVFWVEIRDPRTNEIIANKTVNVDGVVDVSDVSDGKYIVCIQGYSSVFREKFFWGCSVVSITSGSETIVHRSTPVLKKIVVSPSKPVAGLETNITAVVYQPSRSSYSCELLLSVTRHGYAYSDQYMFSIDANTSLNHTFVFKAMDTGSYNYLVRLYVYSDLYGRVLADYTSGSLDVYSIQDVIDVVIDAPETVSVGERYYLTVVIVNKMDTGYTIPVTISSTEGIVLKGETRFIAKLEPKGSWNTTLVFEVSRTNTTETIFVNITSFNWKDIIYSYSKNITAHLPETTTPQTLNTTTQSIQSNTSTIGGLNATTTGNETTAGGGGGFPVHLVIIPVVIIAVVIVIWWLRRRSSYY